MSAAADTKDIWMRISNARARWNAIEEDGGILQQNLHLPAA